MVFVSGGSGGADCDVDKSVSRGFWNRGVVLRWGRRAARPPEPTSPGFHACLPDGAVLDPADIRELVAVTRTQQQRWSHLL